MKFDVKDVNVIYNCIGSSLVGVGRERPCSWGNYFEMEVDGRECRVLNMWKENLEHACLVFTGGDVNIRLYTIDDYAWGIVDDLRIPKDYYNNKLCYTGGRLPPIEIARDIFDYIGDPDNEFEFFTNPEEYYRKRGATYKNGIVTRTFGNKNV